MKDTGMTVEEALADADEWVKGTTFYPGLRGWRVVCAVLAAEVRRLQKEKVENMAQIQGLRIIISDGQFALGFHRAVVEVLQILRNDQ